MGRVVNEGCIRVAHGMSFSGWIPVAFKEYA